MDESIDNDGDDFFYSEFTAAQSVKLSHLNNKSSVLCPKSQNITSQYLALQQLDAHEKMIARAKGIVDNFAPQSLQSYISVVDKQKKKLWRNSESKLSKHKGTSMPSSSKHLLSDEEDNVSLKASSVNKAIQTSTSFVCSNTDDKISWYLEALKQGELTPFVLMKDSIQTISKRRTLNGDILDTHMNCFVKSKKPFSPRIVVDTAVKSKIKEMRCYQPPVRRKKKSSGNSSDSFESYHGEDSEDESKGEIFNNHSEDVETQINRPSERNINDRLHEYLIHQNRVKFEGKKVIPNVNDEDKYLEFLSKVTEHILRSGVYSDRAIQQAFEFHMQYYQEDEDKLQSLLRQVMEGMKISGSESKAHNTLSPFLSRPNTPPVKELHNILVSDIAVNEESPSSQAQIDLLSDPHLLSDSGISIRQIDS